MKKGSTNKQLLILSFSQDISAKLLQNSGCVSCSSKNGIGAARKVNLPLRNAGNFSFGTTPSPQTARPREVVTDAAAGAWNKWGREIDRAAASA
jgi:hypothetical protein